MSKLPLLKALQDFRGAPLELRENAGEIAFDNLVNLLVEDGGHDELVERLLYFKGVEEEPRLTIFGRLRKWFKKLRRQNEK